MARAAVIGEPLRIYGYGLAGALLCPASDRADAVSAWRGMPDDVAVVIVTQRVAAWLGEELAGRADLLPVVLPETNGASERALAPEPGPE